MDLLEPFVEPGAVIGPYRMLEEIGTGGSGQVLKARDVRTGDLRAIKIRFLRRTRDRQPILNLHREYRAMVRCSHPNIVRAYDIGVTDRYGYLVMEYVPGLPADAFISRSGLAPGPRRDRLVAFLGMQIAGALEHIHGRHLIHRDLKPANILVTDNELVKIIDFGIARDVVRGETVDPGDLAGTYAYCSPEQVSEVPLDHRSDLYSLGVVLYEMLTDHLPFEAESPFTFVVKHITARPDPIETYCRDVSAGFRDMILRLLAKKPRERPQTALEVERFLKGFVDAFDQDRRGPRIALYGTPSTRTRRVLEPEFVDRRREFLQVEGAVSLLEAGAGGALLVTGDAGVGKSRLLDEALAAARGRGMAVFSARCLPQSDRPFQCLLDLVAAMAEAIDNRSGALLQTMLGEHLAVLAPLVPQVARLLSDDAVPHPGPASDTPRQRVEDTPSPDRAAPGQGAVAPVAGTGWRESPRDADVAPSPDDDLPELTQESIQSVHLDAGDPGPGEDSGMFDATLLEPTVVVPAFSPDNLERPEEEERLRSAIHAFLTLVPDRPAVLAIKDLQWADAPLVSLLSDLVAVPESPLAAPVIWIGTVSTDELDGEQPIEPWLADPPALLDILPVRPLSRGHVLEMVRSMLQPAAGMEEVAGRLYDLSRGNPLFVYELVHEFVDAGILTFVDDDRARGEWRLSPELGAALPVRAGSLEQMIADRIAQLHPNAVSLVEWLAVLGRPCPFEWLESVTGLAEAQLLEYVEILSARRIVSERIGRRRTTVALYYPRLADAIRHAIDPERLDRMRIRAAEAWLKLMGPDTVTEMVADLLYRAKDYTRAVDYLLQGAARASRLGLHHLAYRRAAQAVRSCVEAPEIDLRRRARADLTAGLALEKVGRLELSLPYLQDAWSRADAGDLEDIAGIALAAMGQVYVRSGELHRALRFLDKAVDRLTRTNLAEHLLPILEAKGHAHVVLGQIDAALLCFDRLVMLEEAGKGEERRARAHRGLAMAARFEGRLETARHWLESARRLADTWGNRCYAERCRLDLACVRFLQGDLMGGKREMERAQAYLERAGVLDASLDGLVHLAEAAVECNDLDRAEWLLDRLDSQLRSYPNQLAETHVALCRGLMALRAGRLDEAARAADLAQGFAAAEGFVALEVLATGLAGVTRVRRGDVAGGKQRLQDALASADGRGAVPAVLTVRLWHAEAVLLDGDRRAAAAGFDAVQKASARIGLAMVRLRACAGRLRVALLDHDEGLAHHLQSTALELRHDLLRGMTLESRRRLERSPELAVLDEHRSA